MCRQEDRYQRHKNRCIDGYLCRQIDDWIYRQMGRKYWLGRVKKKLLSNVDTAWLKLSGKSVVSPKKT